MGFSRRRSQPEKETFMMRPHIFEQSYNKSILVRDEEEIFVFHTGSKSKTRNDGRPEAAELVLWMSTRLFYYFACFRELSLKTTVLHIGGLFEEWKGLQKDWT
jgi:hypothetical protein